jgi:hypothetical protein
LYAHANTLNVLDGTPALLTEEIETDYAIGIDVWVHGDGTIGGVDKGYFWWFNGIRRAELEFKSVCVIHI